MRAVLANLAKATPATPGDPIYVSISSICGPTKVLGVGCFTGVSSVSVGASEGETADFSDVTLTLPMSKVTPPLYAAMTGHAFFDATIDFVSVSKGKSSIYLRIVLSSAQVDSLSLASGGSNPDISASLKYLRIKMTYFTGTASSTFCWDVGTLTSC